MIFPSPQQLRVSVSLLDWPAIIDDLSPDYDIEIRYNPGMKNANADALSRAPIATSLMTTTTVSAVSGSSTLPPIDNSDVMTLSSQQKADPHLKEIIAFLTNHDDVPILITKSSLVLIDNILYFIDPQSARLCVVVPTDMRTQLMEEAHAGAFSGHFAARGLFRKLSKQYWWKGMYADIYHYCRSCLTCASYSGSRHKAPAPLQPLPVEAPFECVGIDIMEMPQTCEGNRYVLVIMDYLTKWVEAFPMVNQCCETIARLLVDHVICRHSIPNQILSDRGSNFLSDLIMDICHLTGMKKINTTAYHPQTDGLVENFNKTLRAMLAKHSKWFGMDWDKHLQRLLFAYRTKPHDSTGESPFYLLYGRDARLPTESTLQSTPSLHMLDAADYRTELVVGLTAAWDIARTSIAKAQSKLKL